ncbi:MAG: hypothetical protein ILA34_03575 [Bacteroidaceae bacterium]|nr:hypothetical protein [Bacteroidaceae bacterium]
MKQISSRLLTALLVAMTGAALMLTTSCSDNDHPVDNTESSEVDSTSVNTFTPEVLTPLASVYVAPGMDANLKQAFTWATAAVESDPSQASILVLNKLTDVSEDVLKKAFEDESGKGGANNFLICVVNPDKAELDAFDEAHDWIWFETGNVTDSTFIFGFNAANRLYFISEPATSEDDDPILTNINQAQTDYVFISGMLTDFADHMMAGSKKDSDDNDLESFANYHHITVTENFSVNRKFRKIALSSADYLSGNCSMTTNYDIYMAHVYEGEPGAGDYYAVKMNASLASAGMWKGKGDNRHGGVHVRWCGWWNTDFIVESHILTSQNANWDEDTNSFLTFTAGGFPSPETTIGKTTYTDTNSFSLTMSQTVGGSLGKTSKGGTSGTSKGVEAELGFSEGWSWEHSESREVSDLDITNETTRGNWARWHLTCNNLPSYSDGSISFKVTDAKTYRGTIALQGSWLWYDKTGKDNEDRDPLVLGTALYSKYKMQSFITTRADLSTETVEFHKEFRTQLPKMVNTTAGGLTIVNNLKDEAAISNVQVCSAETGEVITEFANTVPNGGEQALGHFSTLGAYTVKFKARVPGGQAKDYKYTLNPSIKLTHKATTKLYALNDFTAQ